MAAQARDAEQVAAIAKGAYILQDSDGRPEVILIATGSEVDVAMAAADTLGDKVRVVSMPSTTTFEPTRRRLSRSGSASCGYQTCGH